LYTDGIGLWGAHRSDCNPTRASEMPPLGPVEGHGNQFHVEISDCVAPAPAWAVLPRPRRGLVGECRGRRLVAVHLLRARRTPRRAANSLTDLCAIPMARPRASRFHGHGAAARVQRGLGRAPCATPADPCRRSCTPFLHPAWRHNDGSWRE